MNFTYQPLGKINSDIAKTQVAIGRFNIALTINRRMTGGLDWKIENAADVIREGDDFLTEGVLRWSSFTLDEFVHLVSELVRFEEHLRIEEAIKANPEKYRREAEKAWKAEEARSDLLQELTTLAATARESVLRAKSTGALVEVEVDPVEANMVVEEGEAEIVFEEDDVRRATRLAAEATTMVEKVAKAADEAKAKALGKKAREKVKALSKAAREKANEAIKIAEQAEQERLEVLEAEQDQARQAEVARAAAERQAKLEQRIRDSASRSLAAE